MNQKIQERTSQDYFPIVIYDLMIVLSLDLRYHSRMWCSLVRSQHECMYLEAVCSLCVTELHQLLA